MKRNTRNALKRWLREQGWTQERLAAYLGVRQGNLSLMLSGVRNVSLDAGLKMSELTGIPAEDLITEPKTLELLKSYVTRQNSASGFVR
jgi:transcriptional regulator with XRE-family HTH domain